MFGGHVRALAKGAIGGTGGWPDVTRGLDLRGRALVRVVIRKEIVKMLKRNVFFLPLAVVLV